MSRHEAPPNIPSSLRAAAEAVRGASQIALACHVNPDGDALGSMLGLFHVLRAAGCDVIASFPTPFVTAQHYRELPGLDALVPPQEYPSEPDVMLTFDCGSLGRLGDLEPAAKGARELIVIDHHISNDRYGTINVVDADAAASGWVTVELIDELGLDLNRDAAICLYAALICDTGRFQYDTTTPAVFEMARRLASYEVPVERLSRTLFEEHRFAYLAGRTYPAVETLRRGNQIILRAELPGVSLADLDISVVDHQLLLRGEKRAVREQDDSPTYFREISYGRFERAFTLPQGVKPEQVNARYENGVLEITLPAKALEDASRKVPIQIGAGAHRSAPATGCDRPSVAPARARGPRHQAG
jgi:HSP20 family molecular chaperone IbpA